MTATLVPFEEVLESYDPALGLEVHVELNTDTKMFCGCPASFGEEPNTSVCPVCLGLPGAMPVVNGKAVESAIRIGLALNCEIAEWCRFARKNYFYPDMPKNFQTSQYDEPIAFEGFMDVEVGGETVRVEIERAHMEEDTGKSTPRRRRHRTDPRRRLLAGRLQPGRHPADRDRHQADRRCGREGTGRGAGLRAAAARPDPRARRLRGADGPGQPARRREPVARAEGLRRSSAPAPRPRTSTRSARSSARCATRCPRHAAVLDAGEQILQETRHWHEDTGVTTSGREKSDAEDYRYFPEPDLVPVAPSREWVEELRGTLPENPAQKRARLQADWGFSDLEMRDTVGAGALGLVEETIAAGAAPQAARKWWLSELARRANDTGVDIAELGVTPQQVADVQALVDAGQINDKLARQVFDGLLDGEGTPEEIVAARGLAIVSDEGALGAAVDNAIAANPDVADKIRDGKVAAAGALIGAVMKEMRGQADANRVRELILEKLT